MRNAPQTPSPETRPAMSPEMFANLGGGQIAYIRPFRSEQLNALFPAMPPLEPGQSVWALLAANGAPIMLADSPAAALAGAQENDLIPVAVH